MKSIYTVFPVSSALFLVPKWLTYFFYSKHDILSYIYLCVKNFRNIVSLRTTKRNLQFLLYN